MREKAAGARAPAGGLGVGEGRSLLQDKQLSGDQLAWQELVASCEGNALALRVVEREALHDHASAIRATWHPDVPR